MTPLGFADENIKLPNVSGQFYAGDPQKLAGDIDAFLKAATISPVTDNIQMIIAPHAGYRYSGSVAGYSFKAVSKKSFKTIIILAPSHFYGFDGASIWTNGGFKTPLGVVPVDEDFAKALSRADSKFAFVRPAFDKEHALEVEIPFLQKTFQDFKIVPVILGQMSFDSCQKLSDTLNNLIGTRQDVLVVVSSDMSHYHDDKTARIMDFAAFKSIKDLDAKGFYQKCLLRTQEMCGFIPVTTAILLAKARQWQVQILKYANSGDVTGDRSNVVGYGAVMFTQQPASIAQQTAPFNSQQKEILLNLAKEAVVSFVTEKKIVDVKISDSRLAVPEGAFVSIYKDGQLRGCIGHIVSREPLQKTVRDMAIAAASEDPRFPVVTSEELPTLDFEVSVLSRPWKVANIDDIQMGVHGVIISQGRGKRGVFLPQVATETRWSKEKFLSELCSQKAGLPPTCWKDPKTSIEIFTADVFKNP
ncbi:MAG: AmmeMemoRadiSam system protein B [Candidatus Omnitrophica bacterium]|nr:AmmeMemoRadiSam system protein B [Candidatus Omnitrophota bacterium]